MTQNPSIRTALHFLLNSTLHTTGHELDIDRAKLLRTGQIVVRPVMTLVGTCCNFSVTSFLTKQIPCQMSNKMAIKSSSFWHKKNTKLNYELCLVIYNKFFFSSLKLIIMEKLCPNVIKMFSIKNCEIAFPSERLKTTKCVNRG